MANRKTGPPLMPAYNDPAVLRIKRMRRNPDYTPPKAPYKCTLCGRMTYSVAFAYLHSIKHKDALVDQGRWGFTGD